MKRFLSLAVLASMAFLAPAAQAQENCLRVKQVRAFAVDEDSLIVRQGKGQFRRIVLESGCPVAQADRIGFKQGTSQVYIIGRGSQLIPVTDNSIVGRFCTNTPHTFVSIIDENEDLRVHCRIASIEGSDRDAFEALTVRDNRY